MATTSEPTLTPADRQALAQGAVNGTYSGPYSREFQRLRQQYIDLGKTDRAKQRAFEAKVA